METLIIVDLVNGSFWLKDARNHVIGRFNTKEEAQAWCDQNGYRYRFQKFGG